LVACGRSSIFHALILPRSPFLGSFAYQICHFGASVSQNAMHQLADQAHFNKLFRRFVGESPGVWRRARCKACDLTSQLPFRVGERVDRRAGRARR
jgi:AraC-like DNA-binding protein